MYLKLSFRNALRSLSDYSLYMLSVTILVSILCISVCAAALGDTQAGFNTAALPLLTVAVMVTLADCMNRFIVKQRAGEFGVCMLLGMEKNTLSMLFLLEMSFIGLICFLCGTLLGLGICYGYFGAFLQEEGFTFTRRIVEESVRQTLICFGSVEALSFFFIRRRLHRLEIVELMREKQINQSPAPEKKVLWRRMLLLHFLLFTALLLAVSRGGSAAVSVIAVPALGCVFSFYKWLYAVFAEKRLVRSAFLYREDRLYQIAELTGASRTGAAVNAVFCVCLIFSVSSFVFGTLMLKGPTNFFPYKEQRWMGFLQMMICVIFLVIYFCVLSLTQVLELRRQAGRLWMLYCLGESLSRIKALLKRQLFIRLLLPTPMAFLLLLMAAPTVNLRVNSVMPKSAQNVVAGAAGGFLLCFLLLYLCYYLAAGVMSIRFIKERIGKM